MKESKYLPLFICGLSTISLAQASAGIINTDAGLAGQKFCFSLGWDTETYNRDHTYVYYYTQLPNGPPITYKGTWTIGKDGTVTLKLDSGGAQTGRYDIDGDHVKELTGSLFGWGGGLGHRC